MGMRIVWFLINLVIVALLICLISLLVIGEETRITMPFVRTIYLVVITALLGILSSVAVMALLIRNIKAKHGREIAGLEDARLKDKTENTSILEFYLHAVRTLRSGNTLWIEVFKYWINNIEHGLVPTHILIVYNPGQNKEALILVTSSEDQDHPMQSTNRGGELRIYDLSTWDGNEHAIVFVEATRFDEVDRPIISKIQVPAMCRGVTFITTLGQLPLVSDLPYFESGCLVCASITSEVSTAL